MFVLKNRITEKQEGLLNHMRSQKMQTFPSLPVSQKKVSGRKEGKAHLTRKGTPWMASQLTGTEPSPRAGGTPECSTWTG